MNFSRIQIQVSAQKHSWNSLVNKKRLQNKEAMCILPSQRYKGLTFCILSLLSNLLNMVVMEDVKYQKKITTLQNHAKCISYIFHYTILCISLGFFSVKIFHCSWKESGRSLWQFIKFLCCQRSCMWFRWNVRVPRRRSAGR